MSDVEAASAAPGEKRSARKPAAPVLARASESGDPAVQKLIADMYTAQQNGDSGAEAAAAEALAALGFA